MSIKCLCTVDGGWGRRFTIRIKLQENAVPVLLGRNSCPAFKLCGHFIFSKMPELNMHSSTLHPSTIVDSQNSLDAVTLEVFGHVYTTWENEGADSSVVTPMTLEVATCSPTPAPTTRTPTKAPTPVPATFAPTSAPTFLPTSAPTTAPTPLSTTLAPTGTPIGSTPGPTEVWVTCDVVGHRESFLNDSFCDTDLNNAGCAYDGGWNQET